MPAKRTVDTYHHGDLRRALLTAALELLEDGSEPTLRAVARRAGVSHTAPYHYFADRRALVAAVAEQGLVALKEALEGGVGRMVQPHLQLLESGVAYVRFAVENPARFRVMFSAELADRSGLPDLQAAYTAAYGVLLDAVERVFGPEATSEAVETAALSAWATVHGLSMLLIDKQVNGSEGSVEEVELLTRKVLLHGGPPPE